MDRSAKLGFGIAKGIVEIFGDDSEQIKAIQAEINAMQEALNSGVDHRIVEANYRVCAKFPDLFYFAEQNGLHKVENNDEFSVPRSNRLYTI